MRLLFVGDPHAEPGDLQDCKALADFVLRVAVEQKVDGIVLSGDLYHTHAIIHAEVQLFWFDFFEECSKHGVTVALVKGNHDAPGTEGSRATALIAHKHQAHISALHEPVVEGGVLFCPYTTPEKLVEWSEKYSECETLVCHQTFDGSVYENGMFAPDGVDPGLIKQKRIISGHIHTPQEFGKVWYPGAPRWRTLADANVDRAIWALEFDSNGELVSRTPFDTGRVCRRIVFREDTPDKPVMEVEFPDPKDEFRVDIRGPQAWIDQRKPFFEGRARYRTFATDRLVRAVVRESEGVGIAFAKWVNAFEPPRGTPKNVLQKMADSRVVFR
jgi:DNA repair exonuclease SbcCD nuclease subunit